MPAFLEKLTQKIYHSHKDQLGDICLVLPNRRAALFIRKHLAEIIEKTSFLPGFYSIEDFVLESSGQVLSDTLGLQFKMFDLHCRIQAEDARSIEEFLPYASWMLNDFNEVDMYLADPSQLFGYLGDVKAMSLWNPDGRPLNDFEKRYLAFVRSIGEYYHGLRDELKQEGMAYQGMAFRHLAENINEAISGMRWQRVIFAGFNALTPSEERIVSSLLDVGKAEVYWDADRYYTSDKMQEAGDFLRRYFKELNPGEVMWEEDNFRNPKKINVIGIPKNTGQVKYAGEILAQLISVKGTLDKTALVLPDEGLLIPVLNSIPEGAGEFNVTMGLALKDTPLFALLDNILNLHENAGRIAALKGSSDTSYYSKDLLRVFNHPWVLLMEDKNARNKSVVKKIRESNHVFLSRDSLLAHLSADHPIKVEPGILFPAGPLPRDVLGSFDALIQRMRGIMIDRQNETERKYEIELEYLYHFSGLFHRLRDLLKKHASMNSMKTFRMIFRQMAAQLRIPFYGEPLKGLQVMGVLETRTLDFETIIMLSVNEGILPSARSHNSFIPHDIKKSFGLPTYQHTNKVFAYHFYRLLQRAKDIYLLYNTEGGQLGGSEKSRYITQLLHESRKYNPAIDISEKVLSMPPAPGLRDTSISIEKSDEVIALIRKEARRGFHPSSLNLYINCPLQFYLARLLRIEESEESEETIDNRVLGIVMHETLQALMKDYMGIPLGKMQLSVIKKQIKQELALQFSKTLLDNELLYGKNHLIANVAEKMLEQLINREITWLSDGELIIKDLEKRYEMAISLNINGHDEEILFAGTVDRIDSKNGTIRILDYKTGFVDDKKLAPKEWEQMFTDPEYGKAFQLMMYAWLYSNNQAPDPELKAGILSLRMPGKGPAIFSPPGGGGISNSTLETFEIGLKNMMEEIFNPQLPFAQTDDEARCKFCPFIEMCNRVSAGNSDY